MSLFDILIDILSNVVSEFIVLALLLLVGLFLYRSSGRRRLLDFFGIINTKTVTLYLSNLSIVPGAAIGVDSIPRSYSGPAIPLYEVYLIPLFQRLFNFLIPGAEHLPGFLERLLVSDVTVSVAAAPVNDSDIELGATVITVGSPGFNLVSRRVEEAFHSMARFVNDNAAFQVGDAPPITDVRCAFVQRAVNATTRQVAFYVAGPATIGTTGAAYYLARRWKHISERYPAPQPFCIVLRITSDDARQHEVIFES